MYLFDCLQYLYLSNLAILNLNSMFAVWYQWKQRSATSTIVTNIAKNPTLKSIRLVNRKDGQTYLFLFIDIKVVFLFFVVFLLCCIVLTYICYHMDFFANWSVEGTKTMKKKFENLKKIHNQNIKVCSKGAIDYYDDDLQMQKLRQPKPFLTSNCGKSNHHSLPFQYKEKSLREIPRQRKSQLRAKNPRRTLSIRSGKSKIKKKKNEKEKIKSEIKETHTDQCLTGSDSIANSHSPPPSSVDQELKKVTQNEFSKTKSCSILNQTKSPSSGNASSFHTNFTTQFAPPPLQQMKVEEQSEKTKSETKFLIFKETSQQPSNSENSPFNATDNERSKTDVQNLNASHQFINYHKNNLLN